MRRAAKLLIAITPFQTRKNRETHTDPAHHFTFDPNLSPGHPLDHHLNQRSYPLNVFRSNDSSRPPSTVTIAT